MALIKCKECGAEISTKADACPRCGARARRTSGCAWIISAILCLIFIPPLVFAIAGDISGNIKATQGRTIAAAATKSAAAMTPPAPITTATPQIISESKKTELEETNKKFKEWALKSTSATDIKIDGPSMFVTLTPDKYTNRDKVRLMGESLARTYVKETGESYIVCHMLCGNEDIVVTPNKSTVAARTPASTAKLAPIFDSRKIGLEEANERFKEWALKSTAVTDIAIHGPSMFVTLTRDKYTNRDNVRLIAEALARAYVNQTGESSIMCHVFLGNEEYAKGHN